MRTRSFRRQILPVLLLLAVGFVAGLASRSRLPRNLRRFRRGLTLPPPRSKKIRASKVFPHNIAR